MSDSQDVSQITSEFHADQSLDSHRQSITVFSDSKLEVQEEGLEKLAMPNQEESLHNAIQSLKNEQNQEMGEFPLRKHSFQDGEDGWFELDDNEQRPSLSRTYALEMQGSSSDLMARFDERQEPPTDGGAQLGSLGAGGAFKIKEGQSQIVMDKRSRSETPSKMAASYVLYRAHQKLQRRRKLSPSKLLEKQQMRQRKAQEVRAQIETNKKGLFEKIRARQHQIRERWKEMLAVKKARLYDKLGQAEERREREIQNHMNKALEELKKIDETMFIKKMNMTNLKIEIDSKMNETAERKQQLLEESKQKQQQQRQVKMEAAEKRRLALQKESENKFYSNQQKRQLAEERRKNMLREKKSNAQERVKRANILKRKNELGDKISDIMSFISNSENIWDFLSNDLDWLQMKGGYNETLFFEMLISKDQFELEKLKLKKDAEILNSLIIETDSGQVFTRRELHATALKKLCKWKEVEGSECSEAEEEEEEKELLISSPTKLSGVEGGRAAGADGGYVSDGSDRSQTSLKSSVLSHNFESHLLQEGGVTDEDLNYRLYSIRVKMSMKRNILKRNLSEDLTWADFLKNEVYSNNLLVQNQIPFSHQNNRSLHSTPERKYDIPSEFDEKLAVGGSKGDPLASSKDAALQDCQQSSGGGSGQAKNSISQKVYPSKKKKNPNSKGSLQTNSNEMKSSGSQASSKKTGNSNQASAKSLLQINNQVSQGSQGSFVVPVQEAATRRSTLEAESGRRAAARLHSSSVQECSSSRMHPFVQVNQAEDKVSENQAVNTNAHTGSQMTELITNNKPNPPTTKIVTKRLSTNAFKLLFPIREQSLLFKRPGKEGQFGKCRITLKIEDILAARSSFLNPVPTAAQQNQTAGSQLECLSNESQPQLKVNSQEQQQMQQNSSKKTLQSPPSFSLRKQSTDTNNSTSNQPTQLAQAISSQNLDTIQENSAVSTPTSKIMQPGAKQRQAMEARKLKGSSLPSESSPSPGKDLPAEVQVEENNSPSGLEKSPLNQASDQGIKESIMKVVMGSGENLQLIKNEDSQKTVVIEGVEGDRIMDRLESRELSIRYCRLCELVIPEHQTSEAHTNLKAHKRTRDELGIKDTEDLAYSVINLISIPGDIEKELIKEKEKALKRKVKRIKAQMSVQAESHESASQCPGKDITSANKKRFQIMCIDLEKQVIPIIKDYDALESSLKELIKLLEMKKPGDLHVMRKLKFMPILIEICKRIQICHKSEFKSLGRVLEFVIKLINLFCQLRENRNYMLQTNRLAGLIDLLNWCLNRPTQLFYGITFLPQLLHILTQHVKHRAPYECQQMKELYIEYLICSSLISKMKSKLQIINGPLDLSEMIGQVPLFLLKSTSFLEALTSLIAADSRIRPVYEKSAKIGEQVYFVIQNNELFGIVPMLITVLLSRNQPFKPSQSAPGTKVLPQTILSLAIVTIKTVNNIFRMDFRFAQQLVSEFISQEQLYHLLNYLLVYGAVDSPPVQQEDCKELLHETILLIGYFALFNEKNQQMLCMGENSILQKLCNLPFPYFCDKKLKEILFPSLIQASYKCERNLAVMDQEISFDLIVNYLDEHLKEELPKIIEEENDHLSMSSVGGGLQGLTLERKGGGGKRSPSLSSTQSSNCSLQMDLANGNSPFLPLEMRFPKKLWKDALAFYSKALY